MDGRVGCDGRVQQALACKNHGATGVVKDSEVRSGGRWGKERDGERDELVGEDNVAAASALVVSFGHFAREDTAGYIIVVSVVAGAVDVSVGRRRAKRCAWRMLGP